ncbi:DUF1848 family protein [Candidatus Methanocrinis natronophilus]|uniref:DUF1848 family protein n=1 Tax=Candidatus Methanocrinis natronophilus TaxID=3033396 RepID=A0ABT5X517_9EURY|nr:DUF1848 family protein [Candidatus Methanocrinis natronophilus]MDF0589779.1 DUF1848 family protein [Candidatus Methanocrinis natronophilus]
MIISASYRTDIPAFYGDWFERRLEAGYCSVANPYNSRQVRRVSLRPEDVEGFVFWTRNLGPFMDRLTRVADLGRPFVVQQTVTGYSRELELSLIHAAATRPSTSASTTPAPLDAPSATPSSGGRSPCVGGRATTPRASSYGGLERRRPRRRRGRRPSYESAASPGSRPLPRLRGIISPGVTADAQTTHFP